jgi:DNA repair exonuclease SbcCD nuclease subunit
MSAQPLRFLHASDLHLEQPPFGFAEAPDTLRDTLLEAPWRAAKQLFDVACDEQVDFIILSGDIVDLRKAGPRGIVFLYEQFQRLAEREIHVYWAGGKIDQPDDWPDAVPLPDRVHVFPQGRIEQLTHFRGETPIASISGYSRTGKNAVPVGRFPADPTGLFSVGIGHGPVDIESLKSQRVSYLALGGVHARKTLCSEPRTAHYPGTHQGRSTSERGAHGITLVQIEEHDRPRLRQIATDVLRFVEERLEVTPEVGRTALENVLHERMLAVIEREMGRDLLVNWIISGAGGTSGVLRHQGLIEELLARLRRDFGHKQPLAWSLEIDMLRPAGVPIAWMEEETILGDFLRLAAEYTENSELELDLNSHLTPKQAEGVLGTRVAIEHLRHRREVLQQATWLGAELLGASHDLRDI